MTTVFMKFRNNLYNVCNIPGVSVKGSHINVFFDFNNTKGVKIVNMEQQTSKMENGT